MNIPHITRGLAAATLPVVLLVGGGTATATAAGPTYGPWSSEVANLSSRIAPADAKIARTYVQIRRGDGDGDRQVRIKWQPKGGRLHLSGVRSLEPGDLTTYRTGKIACGKQMTVTLSGRARAEGGAWSEWKDFSGTLTRSC